MLFFSRSCHPSHSGITQDDRSKTFLLLKYKSITSDSVMQQVFSNTTSLYVPHMGLQKAQCVSYPLASSQPGNLRKRLENSQKGLEDVRHV